MSCSERPFVLADPAAARFIGAGAEATVPGEGEGEGEGESEGEGEGEGEYLATRRPRGGEWRFSRL
jgi:hypothetical protein